MSTNATTTPGAGAEHQFRYGPSSATTPSRDIGQCTCGMHFEGDHRTAHEAWWEHAGEFDARPSMAEIMGRVTGSTGATYREERRHLDGTIETISEETWSRDDA